MEVTDVMKTDCVKIQWRICDYTPYIKKKGGHIIPCKTSKKPLFEGETYLDSSEVCFLCSSGGTVAE